VPIGDVVIQLTQSADNSRFAEYQTRIDEIESVVRSLRVARRFEADLHRLRIHLRMVQEDLRRIHNRSVSLNVRFRSKADMPALPPKADISRVLQDVR
jgi:hypothetical protein